MQAIEFDVVDARRLGREQGGGDDGQEKKLHKNIVTRQGWARGTRMHNHQPPTTSHGGRSSPYRAAAFSTAGANVSAPCGSTPTRSCWPSRTSPFKIIRPRGVSTFF